MINVKIYCSKKHKDYDKAYNVINNVLLASNLDFKIERIFEAQTMALHHILYEPHIVINGQVVYTRSCPTPTDVKTILQKLQLIK